MKGFWWFSKGSIAGMARPGFNCTHWFDLKFEEALFVGWLGQLSSGSYPHEKFKSHLKTYGPKISKFYKINDNTLHRTIKNLETEEGALAALERLSKKSELLENFGVQSEQIYFELSEKRLLNEIDYIKKQGFEKLRALLRNFIIEKL